MNQSAPAAYPDAHVASLSGWQQRYVQALRSTVVALAQEAVALNASLGSPTPLATKT